MATSTHNKYVSIPDWFSSSSSTPITSAEKPANITNVYYGGGSGGGTTEIPIDNKTIVWQDQVITVPIDNDKIIINTEGKITTSGTTGVWELRQLTDGTNYIYTTYPVVTQLGITMYAGTDGLDLGSIYDGLPIDNATIYWDLDENGNKILKAVGSSGGVADSVAWANVIGKPDWLLDGKVQYTEIEGIPDLSGFITKDYIDGKFVTFDLNETIDGIKTFTNGIKIGNSLINQSQNDVIYIDGNLAVRGGITMYATDIIDIPSILDSLPVAGTESKGIASFDSSYFSVTNGKVTLLADNVGLNESELAEYLNTNNYAKKSDIPSLNGYATQSWVESKGYALNSDLMSLTTKVDDFLEGSDTDTIINKWLELEAFLSGLSESDNLAAILSNKADKSDLTKYVTIADKETITGEKNFTGGLKVNGSPIYYDSTNKYWKLEGDLLVTGGVTMYGSDSSFTSSTIMDAILYDSATLGINSNGQLYVKGGAGGGINTTDLQNYLTQNSYLNVTDGDNRYLKLSGGTVTGDLSLNQYLRINAWIGYGNGSANFWYDGTQGLVKIEAQGIEVNGYRMLNANNYSSYALPLSGGTITGTANVITINRTDLNQPCISYEYNGTSYGSLGLKGYGDPFVYNASTKVLSQIYHKENISTLKTDLGLGSNAYTSTSYLPSSSYTAADILTKLKTVDGSGSGLEADFIGAYKKDSGEKNLIYGTRSDNTNVRRIYDNGWNLMCQNGSDNGVIATLSSNVASATKLQTARTIWGQSFNGTGNVSGNLTLENNYEIVTKNTSGSISSTLYRTKSNNLSIGEGIAKESNDTYISGNNLFLRYGTGLTNGISLISSGNVGIGATSPSYKLDVNGDARFGSLTPADGLNKVPFAVANGGLLATGWCASIGTSEGGLLLGYRSSVSASVIGSSNASNIVICPDGGFLGVGVTTPSFELEVKGAIRASTYVKVGAQPDNDFPNFINAATTYYGWHTLLGCNGRGFIFGQDREDYTIAKIQPYGSTTAFRYTKIESAVEISNALTTSPATIRFCMNQAGGKDGNANIEFMTGTAYIDWHYIGDTSVDYTTRLIEGSKGVLTLKGGLIIDNTLSVGDDVELKKRAFVKNYITFSDLDAPGGANTSTARIGTFDHSEGGLVIQLGKNGTGSTLTKQRFEIINPAWNVGLMWVDRNGNMFVNGGITMYSDQRKKTILNHVELSLKDIANAPLIEHYYNSDDKKTTHVGSIAQYWASMNDWFCKLDSEGYYTMEIQNAALASAISIARELDRYENKTDKAIKKLKMRICELEEEIERLKSS